jgi:ubiquinone/menaquinone biosynthesis C-methylase UbiE
MTTFPVSDFDQWAETYDRDVLEPRRFPFGGYERVLHTVLRLADPKPGMRTLDLGTGTGNLAGILMNAGCRVWGTDFSPMMLQRARQKVPGATFVLHDLASTWPHELEMRFDRIVSAYVFHHFDLDRKISLLSDLVRQRLASGGKLIVADLSFQDAAAMQQFAAAMGDEWEEEYYWLADESGAAIKRAGLRATYEQVSDCAGVYCIEDGGNAPAADSFSNIDQATRPSG